MGSTTLQLGALKYRFEAVKLPDLQREPERGDGWIRFSQTVGGRTGLPMPRRVSRKPFVQWQAPLVWTTLTLTMHADGHPDFAMTGASPFPQHWTYDGAGQLAGKSSLTDFSETALERMLSAQLMHGGQKPKVTHLKAGDTMFRQGEVGSDLYLVLDGVIRIDRDGEQLAEYGPGALLSVRSRLEHRSRTSTLIAVPRAGSPPCRLLSSTSRRSHRARQRSPAVTGAKKPCRAASCGSTCVVPRTNPGAGAGR
jgi:hypothetical protein